MKLFLKEVRRIVRSVLSEGPTIHFPPGAVKDYVQLAAEMAEVPVSRYKYDKNGSTISFTNREFVEFLEFLKDALNNHELVSEKEKNDIRFVLDHIMKQIPSA